MKVKESLNMYFFFYLGCLYYSIYYKKHKAEN